MDERGHRLLTEFSALSKGDLDDFLAHLPTPVLLVGPGATLGRLDEITGEAVDSDTDTHDASPKPSGPTGPPTVVIPVAKRFATAVADIIWLGRAVTCDVILPFDTVSKVHAIISQDKKGELLVADAGSKNGTFLNHVRLRNGQREPLRDQDALRLGTVVARFLYPESLYLYLKTDAWV